MTFEMKTVSPFRTLLLLAVCLLAGAPSWAQQPLNRLASVQVEEGDDTSRIVVKGDQAPTFTVFKLSDPVRLFVDISNADLSAIQSPIAVNNGVIGEITTLQFSDDVASVARLIVGLQADVPYTVKAQGNNLVVTVDASKRTDRRPVASRPASGEAALADAERRAQAAARRAQEAEARAGAAEQRAREAERRATELAQLRAQDSAAKDAAETARTAAQAQAAEARARVQEAEARAQVAEARAEEARVAEVRAREASAAGAGDSAAAESRARAAEARAAQAEARAAELARTVAQAKADAQAAENRARQAASQAEAQIAATNEAARAAEQRLAELRSQGGATQARIAAAEESAKAARASAERAKAEAAAQSDAARRQIAQANANAAQADARALAAANEAEKQARSAADAASKAQAAAARLTQAESRANAAETRAAQAEARATAAEAERQRLSAELAAIEQQQADTRAQIVRLEGEQSRLASNLKAARAAKDAERAKVIESEERARRSELAAERARLAQLDSAKASSALTQRVAELNNQLQNAQAEESPKADEIARLQSDLQAAQRESGALRGQLKNRDDELAAARAEASRNRQEAETLGAELVTARSTTQAAPVAAVPAPPVTRITNVKFDDATDRTRIRVSVVGRPIFKTLREGERTRILEFSNARIDPAIERTLDTSEFPSAVQIVSSLQAPPPGERVRVVVTLNEQVGEDVIIEGGMVVWSFGKPKAVPQQVVGAVPPPPKWAAPIQRQPVDFDRPKAAVYTGPAQIFGAVRRPKKRKRRYVGRKINIDVKDGDIHNILRLLAKEGNVNIVTSDDVKGTVTVSLKLVPWDQALDIILQTKSLGMVREGNIIRVSPALKLAEERQAALDAQQVKEKLKPLRVKLIPVNYASAKDMLPRVRSVLSERGKAEFDQRTNTVIIKDVIENVEAAEDIISRLDTQTPQVLIEARIVEVNTVNVKQFGIQWGGQALMSPALGNETGLRFPSVIGLRGGADDIQTPANGTATTPNFVVNLPAQAGGGSGGVLGMTFGSIDGAFNLNVRLSALENRGTVKIVSSPKITTLDNKQATISQGVSIPISQVSAAGTQTVFFDAELKLQVTPQVTQDGNIYLQLAVENNTPDFQNVGARGDPTILTKEATTELLLKDGDTTVIGGIYSSNAGTNTSEVPYLASIPILGALFRNYQETDRRTELLIFVTPRIVNRSAAQVRTSK